MNRGWSVGGGQSSLGYLFGGGEETRNSPQPAQNPSQGAPIEPSHKSPSASEPVDSIEPSQKSPSTSEPVDNSSNQNPTNVQERNINNYYRADGQNCGNFITDRPSTKVHAAPGGGSSLGYLFGDDKK